MFSLLQIRVRCEIAGPLCAKVPSSFTMKIMEWLGPSATCQELIYCQWTAWIFSGCVLEDIWEGRNKKAESLEFYLTVHTMWHEIFGRLCVHRLAILCVLQEQIFGTQTKWVFMGGISFYDFRKSLTNRDVFHECVMEILVCAQHVSSRLCNIYSCGIKFRTSTAM